MNLAKTFHGKNKETKEQNRLALFLAIPLALALIIAFSLMAGVVMGYVWEAVCFLRSFSSPEVITDKVPSVLSPRDFQSDFLNQVGIMLDLYNSHFPNNMRYGSGLGFIGGAIISLHLVERMFQSAWSSWKFRFVCGATAGAILGARLDLIFNSDPIPFLVTTALFSVTVGIFLALVKASSQPHVKLLWSDTQVCQRLKKDRQEIIS